VELHVATHEGVGVELGALARSVRRVGTVHFVQQDHQIRLGYLLLADISGYTAFLTGTELEHAHAIIHELTSLIRARLAPPMRFVKLEGDAVFCYADQSTFRDGERFVELVEACYFDFSNRLADMTRSTTCPCDACAAIGSLGLKFIGHHGSYVIEREADREDLAGPDIILIHRLLKNSISEGDGPQAYALFTDTCLSQMSSSLALPTHSEVYDSFGETTGGVHDLGPALDAMRAARRVFLSAEDADVEVSVDLPVPPAVAWQYNVDPVERQRWVCTKFSKDPDKVTPNAQGRLGAGATAHCNHGPGTGIREYVDWRPFDYFTCRTSLPPRLARLVGFQRQMETVEFVPIGEHGTRIVMRAQMMDRRRRPSLRSRSFRPIYAGMVRRWSEALLGIAQEDTAAHGPAEVTA
jgi:Protein of unknown function (DUF2652)